MTTAIAPVALLIAALAGYGILFLLLSRVMAAETALLAALAVSAIALLIYWLQFDHWIHASNRYYLRTALVVITPVFGMLSAIYAMRADDTLAAYPVVLHAAKFLSSATAIRACIGAVVLVTAIHVVQTAKFVTGWTQYTAFVRKLAIGTVSDPSLGDQSLVSSRRIGNELNRLSWSSTTPYLSLLIAPNLKPQRLVVDPDSGFFWLSCRTATASLRAARAVPVESRRLVRTEACLHK